MEDDNGKKKAGKRHHGLEQSGSSRTSALPRGAIYLQYGLADKDAIGY